MLFADSYANKLYRYEIEPNGKIARATSSLACPR